MSKEKKPKKVLFLSSGLVVILSVVGIVAATRPSIQATEVGSPLIGQKAPEASGISFSGKHVSLASERGHFAYVNFFASWCPPCSEEEPSLVEWAFQQSREKNGAQLLSVVYNDAKSAALSFSQKWGTSWPTIMDNQGMIANSFGVGSPPMTFLIDPIGRVVGVWAGPVTVTQLNSMLIGAKASDA